MDYPLQTSKTRKWSDGFETSANIEIRLLTLHIYISHLQYALAIVCLALANFHARNSKRILRVWYKLRKMFLPVGSTMLSKHCVTIRKLTLTIIVIYVSG